MIYKDLVVKKYIDKYANTFTSMQTKYSGTGPGSYLMVLLVVKQVPNGVKIGTL